MRDFDLHCSSSRLPPIAHSILSCPTLQKSHNAICTLCNKTLHIRKSGVKGYTSHDAKEHLRRVHAKSEGSPLAAAQQEKSSATMREGVTGPGKRKVGESGQAAKDMFASSKARKVSRPMPTPAQQIAAQARVYMYHTTSMPKSFFEDPYIRAWVALLTGGEMPTMVHKDVLPGLAKAEWDNVLAVLREMIIETSVVLGGEPHVQVQHDGVTLADHKKYQSIAVTLHFGGRTFTAAIGFKRQGKSGAAEDVSKIIREVVEDAIGMSIGNGVNGFIQDAAANRVPTMFDEEAAAGDVAAHTPAVVSMTSNICGLHDFVKVAEYISKKAHSKGKKEYDYSQVARDGWQRTVKMLNYFAYGSRVDDLQVCCRRAGVVETHPTSAVNGTRMTTVQEGMTSVIRIALGLALYFQEKQAAGLLTEEFVKAILPTEEQWDSLAIQEALIGIYVHMSRASQLENRMLRAIHRLCLLTNKMHPSHIKVLQWKSAAGQRKCGRTIMETADLKDDNKEIFDALCVELDKRYGSLTTSPEAVASVMIDHRSAQLAKKMNLLTETMEEAGNVYLEERYVAHAHHLHAEKFKIAEHAKAKAAVGAAAAAAAAAAHTTSETTTPVYSNPYPEPAGTNSATGNGAFKVADFDAIFGAVPQPPRTDGGIGAWSKADTLHAASEAKRTWTNWVAMQVDYRAYLEGEYAAKMTKYPTDHDLAGQPKIESIDDLMHVQLEKRYYELIVEDQPEGLDFAALGYWPTIAISMLTGLMSSAYVERMNSAAKDAMTDERTRLGADELEVAVLLRINRKLIEYLKSTFPLKFA
jgi:hypothetical protein